MPFSARLMLRRSLSLSLALLLQAASLIFWVAPVAASCIPQRAPHDDDARYVITTGFPAGLTGIKADIREYAPYYSGFNPVGTNASVMLVNYNHTHWAQLGWASNKVNGVAGRRLFSEFYMTLADNRWEYWPAKAVGNTTAYMIRYNGNGFFNFYANGTLILVEQGTGFSPSEYQIFGETHDRADQMPGGTGWHVGMTNARYYTGSTFVSHVVASSMSTSPATWYGFANPANGNYEIWDKACAA